MKNNFKMLLIMSTMLFSLTINAAWNYEPLVKKVYTLYSQGNYIDCIKYADVLISRVGNWGMAHYLKGRSYFKLQDFENANRSFKKALKSKVFPQSSFYEYAQSLYTVNELDKARKFFKKSAKKDFESPNSRYYVASIDQLLENYKTAVRGFKAITRMEKADSDLKQSSHFQIGKIYVVMAERIKSKKKQKDYVNKIVIPRFQKALEVDKNSKSAGQIKREIKDVQSRFKLLYADGRAKKAKKYSIKLTQKIDYDTNVTQSPDDTGSETAVDSAAPLSNTDVIGKYTWDKSNKFIITPELKLGFGNYFSDNSSVTSSNSATIAPSLRNMFKHKVNKEAASLMFDIEYNYFLKDYAGDGRKYFSSATTFVIGEKIKYFKLGDSSLKLKFKMYTGYQDSLNSSTATINFTQFIALPKKRLVLVIFNMDSVSAEVESNSTTSYMVRGDYIGLSVYKSIKFQGGLAFTMLDTGLQSETRGSELTINPSIKFTMPVLKKGKAGFGYNYTTKSSKQESIYAYNKHLFSLDLSYRF